MENNLKRYRKMAQITQTKLAQTVGCRRETIGQIEAGRHNPSLDLAWRIVETLDFYIKENNSVFLYASIQNVFPNPYDFDEILHKLALYDPEHPLTRC